MDVACLQLIQRALWSGRKFFMKRGLVSLKENRNSREQQNQEVAEPPYQKFYLHRSSKLLFHINALFIHTF